MPAELAHLVARLGRRLGAGRWRRHGRSGFGVRFLGGMSRTLPWPLRRCRASRPSVTGCSLSRRSHVKKRNVDLTSAFFDRSTTCQELPLSKK